MFKRNRQTPWVGLSLMPDAHFFEAAQPLFAEGAVEVLEWSFDMGWQGATLPNWVHQLIDFFSQRDRLLGHGVTYSLLSAAESDRQTQWLSHLNQDCRQYRYHHISEHFGWMSAGAFYQSAPLPMPFTPKLLKLGRDRLQQLADQTTARVGLENLAFAFGQQDVEVQGAFIDQLLEPVNGFLLLDLHNLYCQMHNFQQSAADLLARYPLHRVRELHVSGGSWSQNSYTDRPIRRDTHNDAVPEEVFELLAIALRRCPSVKAVIFEQLGPSLQSEEAIAQFRQDFNRIQHIVKTEQGSNPRSRQPELPERQFEKRPEDQFERQLKDFATFQAVLLETLYHCQSIAEVKEQLQSNSAFAPFANYLDTFEDPMVAVAAELVKTWGRR